MYDSYIDDFLKKYSAKLLDYNLNRTEAFIESINLFYRLFYDNHLKKFHYVFGTNSENIDVVRKFMEIGHFEDISVNKKSGNYTYVIINDKELIKRFKQMPIESRRM